MVTLKKIALMAYKDRIDQEVNAALTGERVVFNNRFNDAARAPAFEHYWHYVPKADIAAAIGKAKGLTKQQHIQNIHQMLELPILPAGSTHEKTSIKHKVHNKIKLLTGGFNFG